MTIATKTLATIMLIAMLSLQATSLSALMPESNNLSQKRQVKQLERLYRKHDKKMELRASVLGISSDELRDRMKKEEFDHIAKKSGFKDRQAFHTALVGKLKDELRGRGWNDTKIQQFISNKLERYRG